MDCSSCSLGKRRVPASRVKLTVVLGFTAIPIVTILCELVHILVILSFSSCAKLKRLLLLLISSNPISWMVILGCLTPSLFFSLAMIFYDCESCSRCSFGLRP